MPHLIRLAQKADKKKILDFLSDQWNPNHIYIKAETLFDYDFLEGDRLNFIIALDEQGEIDGTLGFIAYSPELVGCDVFTVMWKVRPKNGDPSLGVSLLNHLIKNYGLRSVFTVGANPKTLPIYQFLGYTVGKLEHFVLLNDRPLEFRVAVVPDRPHAGLPQGWGDWPVIPLESHEALSLQFRADRRKEDIPYKDASYLKKRYFNHPFYQYKVLGLGKPGEDLTSILIARENTVSGTRILRLVDFIGDPTDLACSGKSLKALVHDGGYEYMDFYQYGISPETMTKAGFLRKSDWEGLIVPNYFEPFEQRNVPIHFFSTLTQGFRLFKADGDQDRPSRLNPA